MNSIELSKTSIEQIIKLCEKIKLNNVNNDQTTKMAVGIAHFVRQHRYVSYKQAVWLRRNFDHWGVKRTPELADIVVPDISKYLK